MITLLSILLLVLWSRFGWPNICAFIASKFARTSASPDVNNKPIIEVLLVYSGVCVGLILALLPRMFLYCGVMAIILGLFQIGFGVLQLNSGVYPYAWTRSIGLNRQGRVGNRRYNNSYGRNGYNNGYSTDYDRRGRRNQRGMYQDRQNQLGLRDARGINQIGTVNGSPAFLVEGTKKTYVVRDCLRKGQNSIQGTQLCQQAGQTFFLFVGTKDATKIMDVPASQLPITNQPFAIISDKGIVQTENFLSQSPEVLRKLGIDPNLIGVKENKESVEQQDQSTESEVQQSEEATTTKEKKANVLDAVKSVKTKTIKIDGVTYVAVNGAKDTYISQKGVLLVQTELGRQYRANKVSTLKDKEGIIYFVFANEDLKEILPFFSKQATQQYKGVDSHLISVHGDIYGVETDNSEDAEDDTVTMNAEAISKGFGMMADKFKVLRMQSETKIKQVKNKDWLKDGIYNDGTVDLACRYGELAVVTSCAILPEMQSLIVAELKPNYALKDMIPKTVNWQLLRASSFVEELAKTIRSCQTKKDQPMSVNCWFRTEKRMFFISAIVFYYEFEKYVKECKENGGIRNNNTAINKLKMSLFTDCGISQSEDVNFNITVNEAEREKCIIKGNGKLTSQKWHSIYMYDALPNNYVGFIQQPTSSELDRERNFLKENKAALTLTDDIKHKFICENGLVFTIESVSSPLTQMLQEKRIVPIKMKEKDMSVYKYLLILAKQKVVTLTDGDPYSFRYIMQVKEKNGERVWTSFVKVQSELISSKMARLPIVSIPFYVNNWENVLQYTDKYDVTLYIYKQV